MMDTELIRMLKYGKSSEVEKYIREKRKEAYPNQFIPFMDRMMEEYQVSRKEVALHAGLSQDYTYKLLRGDKTTNERDYIIAICLAIGMNIAQTQHALESYGMAPLNKLDYRSAIIYYAIDSNCTMETLNAWLEKAKYPLLKVHPKMPSAKIELMNEVITETEIMEKIYPDFFEIVSKEAHAEHFGNAPMDFNYYGFMIIQNPVNPSEQYRVEACYMYEFTCFAVFAIDENGKPIPQETSLTNKKYQPVKIPDVSCPSDIEEYHSELLEDFDFEEEPISNPVDGLALEYYNTLEDAGKSQFFRYFLELEKLTDDKVREQMDFIDDTRNYGVRCGAKVDGGILYLYLEAFNTHTPAAKEYFQIVRKNGETTYSVAHESCFMRIECGSFYSIYFNKREEPEYLIKSNSIQDIAKNRPELKFLFTEYEHILHKYVEKEIGSESLLEFEETLHEKLELLAQRSTLAIKSDEPEESLKSLLEMLDLLEGHAEDYFGTLFATYYKCKILYEQIDDDANARIYFDKMYSLREKVWNTPDDYENKADMMTMLGHIIHSAGLEVYFSGNTEQAKKYMLESIRSYDGYCQFEEDWIYLFDSLQNYAALIDETEPEEACKYYKKALSIARKQNLYYKCGSPTLVSTVFNNYAWVLWNKLGSEEAITYYNQALDLLEDIAEDKTVDEETIQGNMEHIGDALLEIYEHTGHIKEADSLKQRLSEYNVILENEQINNRFL